MLQSLCSLKPGSERGSFGGGGPPSPPATDADRRAIKQARNRLGKAEGLKQQRAAHKRLEDEELLTLRLSLNHEYFTGDGGSQSS